MLTKILVLCTYFLIVLIIGFIARTRWKSTPDTYFLADRKLGTLILLGTMVATSGDEAFVMLAVFPGRALILMAGLFAMGWAVAHLTDRFLRQLFNRVEQ